MEIAATIQRLNHQIPVAMHEPIPIIRFRPDPTVLNTRPASVGQNNKRARTLMPPTPRRWETSTVIHDKCSANNAPTAIAENTTPAIVNRFLIVDAALGGCAPKTFQHVRHKSANHSVRTVRTI